MGRCRDRLHLPFSSSAMIFNKVVAPGPPRVSFAFVISPATTRPHFARPKPGPHVQCHDIVQSLPDFLAPARRQQDGKKRDGVHQRSREKRKDTYPKTFSTFEFHATFMGQVFPATPPTPGFLLHNLIEDNSCSFFWEKPIKESGGACRDSAVRKPDRLSLPWV